MSRNERETGFEDEDEGQRARVPLNGVRRIGPEDPSGDEAAAFGAVGAGSKMRRMIEHHRRLFPAADRAMLRRKWDEPRSEELLEHTDALADALGIDNLEGVGVRGTTARTRILTLVTRGTNGRAHKSWLPYSVLDGEDFADIKEAVENAANIAEARRKGMVLGLSPTEASAGAQADSSELRRRLDALEANGGANDELQSENDDLRARVAELEAAQAAPDEAAAAAAAADDLPLTITAIKKAIAACDDDESRAALKARIREAEEARDEPRRGVLEAAAPDDD